MVVTDVKQGLLAASSENLESSDRCFFIMERQVRFEPETAELASDNNYFEEVLEAFKDNRVKYPHVTLLNTGDVKLIHAAQSDGRSIDNTRRILSNSSSELHLPATRHCNTGKADLFYTYSGNILIGFHLDDQGKKLIRNERQRLLGHFGVENPVDIDPHVSVVRADSHHYAGYVAESLNKTLGSLSITLLEPGLTPLSD